MTKQVTRTIKTYTIHASTVKAVNGKIETTDVADITAEDQTVTEAVALRMVQKAYGKKDQYIIRSIDVDETTYAVPFDVFMAYAVKVEKAPTQDAVPAVKVSVSAVADTKTAAPLPDNAELGKLFSHGK